MEITLPKTTIEELLEAGTHFGSWTHAWNPAMKKFIHGRRNKIHIINLVHTVRGLARASHFLREVAATGRQIVYVGTKRQMQGILRQEVARVEMPWVTERWLGGSLTNFKTVRSRLTRLEELEHMDETGEMAALKKKAQSQFGREKKRIKKNLEGLRNLSRMPGALLIIDPKREHIAVAEAKKMGVPVVAILDTDCDPRPIDIPIPANDDSMRSIALLLGRLTDAIEEGCKRFKESGRAPEDALGVRGEDGSMIAVSDSKKMAASMRASAGVPAAKAGTGAGTGAAPDAGTGAAPDAAPDAATGAAPDAATGAAPDAAAPTESAAPATTPEAPAAEPETAGVAAPETAAKPAEKPAASTDTSTPNATES
ncbi:MAG: 30S ribosomal protein S2 [Planctomycetota bacterium]|nr:MAG: 30S ribosomal protein S2 [Planctomycetota bacterium]